MIRINLIPPEYVERLNRKAVIAKAVLAGFAVVAVIVLASLWQITRAKTVASLLARRDAELTSLQKEVDQVKAIEARISEVQRYLDSIDKINKNRFVYTRFLQDLTGDLPATLWFTGVNTSFNGELLKADIAVNAHSAYDLAYWINSLETSGPYSEVTVGAISVSETEDGKSFTVPISLRYSYR
jgi:Tfp pilus assembly protein PilN